MQINLSRSRRRLKFLVRRLIKRRDPAKRIHVEEKQSIDVKKSFAESISTNFTVLTESMNKSFQKLGENCFKIYLNSLKLTKFIKAPRSIRTMGKTLTS